MENLVSPRPHSENPDLPRWQRPLDELMSMVLPAFLHRLVRFSISGLVAAFFYLVLVNAFVLLAGISAAWASALAYLSSLALSYLLQSTFTFRATDHSAAQVTRFIVTSVAGLLACFGVMWIVTDVLGLSYVFGQIALCVLIPVINFLAYSRWVFTRSAPKADDE